MSQITCSDSLEFLRKQEDYSFDINYSDPPYALGSEVIVRPDGKVDYKKANDFMNKWEMPTGAYWEQWFKEAYRTLKYGGYCIMFGMDRQLLLFKYYACLAGFTEKQSLYWYFISNFPKATDLSKQIDKNKDVSKLPIIGQWLKEKREECNLTREQVANMLNLTPSAIRNWEDNPIKDGFPTKQNWEKIKVIYNFDGTWDDFTKEAEREVVGKKTVNGNETTAGGYSNGIASIDNKNINIKREIDITTPSTELAKKYEGYKYSISPLKQTNETILVFQKPYKTGSCLHDTLAYENGDNTCCCGALDIDGNRVGTETIIQQQKDMSAYHGNKFGTSEEKIELTIKTETAGRYPAQTFIDSNIAEVLDKQSDIAEGGCSKILHKCDFEKDEHDLYFYNPKVSKSERNAGCEGDEQQYSHDGRNKEIENPYQRNKSVAINNHPTLKPIKLNKNILSLFKTPNEQQIVYPFAGSGSEVIGGIKAGFTSYIGCEINQEYIDIANARIKFWKDFEGCELPAEQAVGQISIWEEI